MISLNSLYKLVTVAALASSTVRAVEPESLDRTLEPYLKEFGLPALAAAVFKEGVVIASGVVCMIPVRAVRGLRDTSSVKP
jgi:hypothetical protein